MNERAREILTLQHVLSGKKWEPTEEERKAIEEERYERMVHDFERCGMSSWIDN